MGGAMAGAAILVLAPYSIRNYMLSGAVVGISTEAARAISAAGFISAAALIPGNDTMEETSPTDR